MPHPIAKLLLENAHTPQEVERAIEIALELGMPFHEVEEYMDWLESVRRSGQARVEDPEQPS